MSLPARRAGAGCTLEAQARVVRRAANWPLLARKQGLPRRSLALGAAPEIVVVGVVPDTVAGPALDLSPRVHARLEGIVETVLAAAADHLVATA